MLGNIFTELTRNAWTTVPGRSTEQTWTDDNCTSITYKEGTTVIFIQNLTYDANNHCIKVECVAPQN